MIFPLINFQINNKMNKILKIKFKILKIEKIKKIENKKLKINKKIFKS